ncbi:DUF2971 domain-containing protein [Vibrio crassostreae]|uniref:DUF2971 family protein n=1 Tax=Vibrio crassostreae TaxID=246167 RepID=A0ABM9QL79_9VIBR|nr:DUF2971 domain-containing protein [Vibrio crassostreae]CAK2377196.1 DUF2971 domain-containing protein [Vibrio crassostreae]CAK2377304.1 DUF2971 domain-containing protein [Vibrio crassostreae]CAK2991518.1 DUF2971 domain-containing protein [Vibrio crassostreae]CAK3043002.1 DUF2971 domain-containing protein [Vibrio crassostreae]CDS94882.1 conserved hypothetical protein [Vibrio crassostreae]
MAQPNKVFRYQKFSALSIDALCHDQLYFADPKDFNDPLDCSPSVMSDSDIHELRQILTEQIRKRVEAETLSSLDKAKAYGEGAEAHASKMGRQAAEAEVANIAYYATDPDYNGTVEECESWLLTVGIQRELLKQYDKGICCFSSSDLNPLLWSHYGDQHRGFCVGYSLNRSPKPNLHKVNYGSNRIVHTSAIAKAMIEGNQEYQQNLDENVLLRKAPPWSYEEEWRLLGRRGIQDSVLMIEEVTFGLRCPTAVMHSIISALENRSEKVEFYEMYQTRESFTLKKRSVDDEILHHLPRTARSGIEIFG